MIPAAEVEPSVLSPLPDCTVPAPEEIDEEGFGFFRGTWAIGCVPLAEAAELVRQEGAIIAWLDDVADSPGEFEQLASAIEHQDLDVVADPLRQSAIGRGLDQYVDVDDEDALELADLEIGVAGLTYALSSIGCPTAASCRWHVGDRSWSFAPVVFFATEKWRVERLSQVVSAERCGIGFDRDMFTVYGASIRDTHRLAGQILASHAWLSRP